MRPLRILCSAVVLSSTFMLPATSMAYTYHSWCVTGDPLSKGGSDSTTNEIVSYACTTDKDPNCCNTANSTGRWSLSCVQWAADYAYNKQKTTPVDYCGRYAWTQSHLDKTEQYFPRDYNIVALNGDVVGLRDVDDPVAASNDVSPMYFAINVHEREPVAVVSGHDAILQIGTVYGSVFCGHTLNDPNVTYIPASSP
jgi:hypothetical protein